MLGTVFWFSFCELCWTQRQLIKSIQHHSHQDTGGKEHSDVTQASMNHSGLQSLTLFSQEINEIHSRKIRLFYETRHGTQGAISNWNPRSNIKLMKPHAIKQWIKFADFRDQTSILSQNNPHWHLKPVLITMEEKTPETWQWYVERWTILHECKKRDLIQMPFVSPLFDFFFFF